MLRVWALHARVDGIYKLDLSNYIKLRSSLYMPSTHARPGALDMNVIKFFTFSESCYLCYVRPKLQQEVQLKE